jgi:transcriptional regulator of met regulon
MIYCVTETTWSEHRKKWTCFIPLKVFVSFGERERRREREKKAARYEDICLPNK